MRGQSTLVYPNRALLIVVAVLLAMAGAQATSGPAAAQEADPSGADPAAPPSQTVSGLVTIMDTTGVTAYGNEGQNNNFIAFDLGAPGAFTPVVPETDAFAGDFADDGLIYELTSGGIQELRSVTTTGMMTTIDTVPANGYTGMAWDSSTSTMFVSSVDCGTASTLQTIDLATAELTVVGTITNAPCLIALAANDVGDLYGYDILTDMWLAIDPATGAGTEIGPIGFDAGFAQGLDYDSASDTFYMASYIGGSFEGILRTVDETTGATTIVGSFGSPTEVTYLAIDNATPTCEGHPATITGAGTINGTEGDDVIVGSAGDDTINGLGGDDVICAGPGNDTVNGGNGKDTIRGQAGDDILDGGNQDDDVHGNDGNDEVYGGQHDDIVRGGIGDDIVLGQGSRDLVEGGPGNDYLHGNQGGDTVNGGDGDDTILGGQGYDRLIGDAGNDTIDGGPDNDTIRGEDGDDTLNGGDGDDRLFGGPDTDICNGDAGADQVAGSCETANP